MVARDGVFWQQLGSSEAEPCEGGGYIQLKSVCNKWSVDTCNFYKWTASPGLGSDSTTRGTV